MALNLNINCITKEQYKRNEIDTTVYYGVHDSFLGKVLVAVYNNMMCELLFIEDHNINIMIEEIKERWYKSTVKENYEITEIIVKKIFDSERDSIDNSHLDVLLKGTEFQIKVWKTLLNIPIGHAISYKDVALMIGNDKAQQAVGSAVGANPITYIIPCHRVIKSNGDIGHYRWGKDKKKEILELEGYKTG